MLGSPVNRIDRQVAFGKPNAISRIAPISCGSEPARDEVGTFNIDVA